MPVSMYGKQREMLKLEVTSVTVSDRLEVTMGFKFQLLCLRIDI
ncbi:hypothetical protein [Nostoc sp. UHCC 0251]|nr:hypothetical protein [Nostoc sp. UHCC 0251]